MVVVSKRGVEMVGTDPTVSSPLQDSRGDAGVWLEAVPKLCVAGSFRSQHPLVSAAVRVLRPMLV